MEEKGLLKQKSLDDVISRIGYGRYQLFVFLVSSFTSFTQGSELVILSIFQKYLIEVHSLDSLTISLLATVIFAGQTLGIIISGLQSDTLGRLSMLKLGYSIIVISGLLSSLIENYIFFIILRSITNIGIGLCLPVGTAYTLENAPSKGRGILAISFELFYMLGQGIVLLLVYFLMNNFDGSNWWLVFGSTCVFGIGALALAFLYLHESPWFLLRLGRLSDGLAVMESISMKNTGKGLSSDERKIIEAVERQVPQDWRLKRIFDIEHRYRTIRLMWVMATNVLGFAGAFYLLPVLLDSSNFYLGFLLCIVFILPFWILALMMIERQGFGRKNTLGLYFTAISVVSLAGCAFADTEIANIVVLGSICGLASVSNIILVPFILEQYETEIRPCSYTVINICARVQMMYMPLVFSFISYEPLYPIFIYAVIYCFSAYCIFTINFDTTGRELDHKYN